MEKFNKRRNGLIGILCSVALIIATQIAIFLETIPNGGWLKAILAIIFLFFSSQIHNLADVLINNLPPLRRIMFGEYSPEGYWLELVKNPESPNSISIAVVSVYWSENGLSIEGVDYLINASEQELRFINCIASFSEGRMRMVGRWVASEYGEASTYSEKCFHPRKGGPVHYTGYFFNIHRPDLQRRFVVGFQLNKENEKHQKLIHAYEHGSILTLIKQKGSARELLIDTNPDYIPHLFTYPVLAASPSIDSNTFKASALSSRT